MGNVTFEKISKTEAWKMFDDASRRLLNMPGQEFADKWDAGEFKGHTSPEMMEVLALRPYDR